MKYWMSLFLITFISMTITAQDEERTLQDRYFYTYHQASGNRVIDGQGTFPNVRVVDVPLSGVPSWAVGYAIYTSVWHIVLEDGTLEIIELDESLQSVAQKIQQPDWFASAQPPIVGVSQLEGAYVMRNDNNISRLTHPIPVNDFEVLYIAANGDVVLSREAGEIARLPVNALPDGRLVMNSKGQIALYANASNQRYVHAIMGDDLEGATLLVLEIVGTEIRVIARVDLPGEDVFEGLSPIWADVDEDGNADLITTVSNGSLGARIRAYLFDGTKFVSEVNGPAIGQGNRWRHQLAWGAFGPNGENELVDVLTPHIGGVVEFYQFDGSSLNIVEGLGGVTSHLIGSRNLDMGVAGDFNGDGQLEIVVVNQARNQLVAIQHTANGAEAVWSLPVDGTVVTNISAVKLLDERLVLAVGTADGRLRIWVPQNE